MDWLAILRRSGGIDALARQVGQPPANVSAGAEVLLPALLDGLRDYAQRHGGPEAGVKALLAMIDGLGDGNLAAAVMGPEALVADAGETIVDQLFGSTEPKQRLAHETATTDEREATMLERMLPVLAMLVCGYISARAGTDQDIEWLLEALGLEDQAPRRKNSGSGR